MKLALHHGEKRGVPHHNNNKKHALYESFGSELGMIITHISKNHTTHLNYYGVH